MVIKKADDRSEDIFKLTALMNEPGLTPDQKKKIEQEIRILKKGAWGEDQAAYYIDTHFDAYKNTIVLHDLRIVFSNERTAQIDHLIINRWLDIYVLESKNWNSLTVDETGACTIWDGRIVGVESPLEQAKRHIASLKRTFEIDPVLRELAPRQNIIPRVLLASGCHLKAPHHRDCYIKADAFHSAWEKDFENESMLKSVLSLTRMVSRETLIKIGAVLTEIHNPGRRDWRAKFGLMEKMTVENQLPTLIAGFGKDVPKSGSDWFILKRVPSPEEKKKLKAAGYFAKKEGADWVWRMRA